MQLNKDVLKEYRIQRCKETIQDAKLALENNRYHTAENRIYYAIFYLVSALAIQNDFSTSKHSYLMGWFNKNFVQTGRVSKQLSRIYKNAFEKRQEGDYDDMINFTLNEVQEDFNDMILFVEEIEKLI